MSVVMTSGGVATAERWRKPGCGSPCRQVGIFRCWGPVLFIAQGNIRRPSRPATIFLHWMRPWQIHSGLSSDMRRMTDISYYTAGMTTEEAFLTAMPAYTTVIVPGTTAANLADAPAQTCIYQLSRERGTDNMSGKCYGAEIRRVTLYACAGMVKNVKRGDLSAYVPMGGQRRGVPDYRENLSMQKRRQLRNAGHLCRRDQRIPGAGPLPKRNEKPCKIR